MDTRLTRATQRGLGLVELMVGMLVGLITTVVIFQVVTTAEQSKRITSAGADVQAAGSMGLYFLERDLQQAGLGVGRLAPGAANCTVRTVVSGAPLAFRMRPVEIIDGGAGDGGSDTLDVLVGNSGVSVGPVVYAPVAAGTLNLASRAGYFDRDVFVAVPGGAPTADCTMSTVSGLPVDPLLPTKITHGTAGRIVPPAGYDFGGGGDLFNLGAAPRLITYRIESTGTRRGLYAVNRLAPAAAPVEIGAGIIDLQALYGYDADGDNVIAEATGGAPGEWVAVLPVPTDWGRVLAVRVALLARSSELSREIVTPALPTWAGGSQSFHPAADADWQRYRYRVYEATVTLRNVLWGL